MDNASMATLMGVSENASQGKAALARVNVVSTALKGEIEVGGKKIKTDVIPVGAYKITLGDDVFYAENVSIRIFAQRQQWQRWNASTNEMEKSVMANSLNGDMQDSVGGFNLGRPSGYIEDFAALPEATKEVMRSVKRVKIFMGLLTVKLPMDENGEPSTTQCVDVPFVMDVKNRDSMKNIDTALSSLKRKNLLPIMSTILLAGDEGSIPTGATYGYSTARVGDKVDLTEPDNDTLKDFLSLIEYSNGKVLDLYNERSDRGLSKADASLVGSIIDVDEAPF
tara:strand:- start:120 stop:962 length:843 start_codon:yes stop_codon:yes gene_type:complete